MFTWALLTYLGVSWLPYLFTSLRCFVRKNHRVWSWGWGLKLVTFVFWWNEDLSKLYFFLQVTSVITFINGNRGCTNNQDRDAMAFSLCNVVRFANEWTQAEKYQWKNATIIRQSLDKTTCPKFYTQYFGNYSVHKSINFLPCIEHLGSWNGPGANPKNCPCNFSHLSSFWKLFLNWQKISFFFKIKGGGGREGPEANESHGHPSFKV